MALSSTARTCAAALLLAPGCVRAPAGAFAALGAPANAALLQQPSPRVSGRACSAQILGLPFPGYPPALQRAVERALAAAPQATALADVSLTFERFLGGLVNVTCVRAEGVAVSPGG